MFPVRWDLGTLDHVLIRIKKEKMAALKDMVVNNQLHFSLSQDTVHETISHNDLDPFWTELKNYFFAALIPHPSRNSKDV